MKASNTQALNRYTALDAGNRIDRLAKRLLLHRLKDLRFGALTLIDKTEKYVFGEKRGDCVLTATINVNSSAFYPQIVFGGTIGAGEAYMAGDFNCSDLTAAVQILLRNRAVLDGMDNSALRLTAPLHKLFHWMHANNRRGSRKNIAAHYDLGNEFFELFLDESMMYSCAVFDSPDMELEQASISKLDRICRKLALTPDDHVLEIGTGWGGFAIHAARHYGCRVTTTTISRNQHELARKKLRQQGLQDRITLLQRDYRDLSGKYDKLVSIEMIEAIGHRYLDTFFAKCSDLLKPDGMMLLQAITIADQRYKAATRTVDFIQRYIFPGSFIPSITAMSESVARATDMRMFHMEDIGPHYATTLHHWRNRFLRNAPAVRALGYPETFLRMWEFYLCYCEGGFRERAIGDAQIAFIKPQCRIGPIAV